MIDIDIIATHNLIEYTLIIVIRLLLDWDMNIDLDKSVNNYSYKTHYLNNVQREYRIIADVII